MHVIDPGWIASAFYQSHITYQSIMKFVLMVSSFDYLPKAFLKSSPWSAHIGVQVNSSLRDNHRAVDRYAERLNWYHIF